MATSGGHEAVRQNSGITVRNVETAPSSDLKSRSGKEKAEPAPVSKRSARKDAGPWDREERSVVLLYFLSDFLMYWAALSLSTAFRLDTLAQIDFLLIQRDRMICAALFALAAMIAGVYKPSRMTDRFDAAYYMLIALGAALVAQLALATLLPLGVREISRRELVLTALFAAVLLTAWHYRAAAFIARFTSLHRFFYVLGDEKKAKRIAAEIRKGTGAFVDARYASLESLQRKCERREKRGETYYAAPEDAIVVQSDNRDDLSGMIVFSEKYFRRTYLYPSLHDTLLFQHSNLLAIAGIPLIEVASRQLWTPYLYVKRAIDVAASATGLLLSLPISIVTAIAITFTSPGGVFYTQERLGLGGHRFKIMKFRSMRSDVQLKDESGHVLAQTGDPRITAVGRFIRKHRIDEIPQLINVLKGDMSLVGPRPVWHEFYEQQRETLPLFDRRLAVRPGLTSLSHVLGSYSSEPEDRLRYDLIYINTLSLVNDLRILLATARIVLSGKGAR